MRKSLYYVISIRYIIHTELVHNMRMFKLLFYLKTARGQEVAMQTCIEQLLTI